MGYRLHKMRNRLYFLVIIMNDFIDLVNDISSLHRAAKVILSGINQIKNDMEKTNYNKCNR